MHIRKNSKTVPNIYGLSTTYHAQTIWLQTDVTGNWPFRRLIQALYLMLHGFILEIQYGNKKTNSNEVLEREISKDNRCGRIVLESVVACHIC